MFLRSKLGPNFSSSYTPMGTGMSELRPSAIKRFISGLRRPVSAAPSAVSQAAPARQAPQRPLIHDLNNVLGVVIGCLDEQLEQLAQGGEIDKAKFKQLAEDGLAAALRGAALTRRPPDQSGS